MRWFRLNGPGQILLGRELRARRRAVIQSLCWSVMESLPSLVSGLAVAAAIDRFIRGDVLAGLGVLALLPAAAVGSVFAPRRRLTWRAGVVVPGRDAFLTAVVTTTVARATGPAGRSDTADVARLTEQVQAVRDTLSALLRTIRQIAFSILATIAGLAVLAPAAALVSGVLLVLALALLAALVPRITAQYRSVLLAEEDVARRTGAAFEGLRDAIACSARGT
jgi:ABC-type siderophore export system fused ATPase/permease subunit